jgi:hypothetical protein
MPSDTTDDPDYTGPDTSGEGCATGTQLVYTLAWDGAECPTLETFDPRTLQFHEIGTINCATSAGVRPNALAISRAGLGYMSMDDGSLWTVNLTNAAAERTSYVSGQLRRRIWSLAFVADASSSGAEELYASTVDAVDTQTLTPNGLAKLSLSAYALSVVGGFSSPLEGKSASITGNGAGVLLGLFSMGPPQDPQLAQIELANAATPLHGALPPSAINSSDTPPPFVLWGGDLWFFAADRSVIRYRLATDRSVEAVVPPTPGLSSVHGAAVSTCAPILL